MNSLFIAYQNDERCHFVGRISSPALISFYCIFIVSLYVLYFCFCIYVYQHLKQSTGVVPRFLSGISRIGSLQPYLGINVTGLVQFGKIMSNILHSLACQNQLLRSISVKLIYQVLYLINGSLGALKKSSEKTETRIKTKQSKCYSRLVTVERGPEIKISE